MRPIGFVVIVVSTVTACSSASLSPAKGSELPTAMRNALHQVASDLKAGRIPKRPLGLEARSGGVCSIPLLEPPRSREQSKRFDRMAVPTSPSLDHNQISPPAPPCTWSERRSQPENNPGVPAFPK
jgi:hypothetical protein